MILLHTMGSVRRPQLINFIAIESNGVIAIKAYIAYSRAASSSSDLNIPFKSISLIRKRGFSVVLRARSESGEVVLKKNYQTDDYGILEVQVTNKHGISAFDVYETSAIPGIEINVGSYFVTKIQSSDGLLICDFDKTLCETKFSSAKDIFQSLRSPLSQTPPVAKTIELVQKLKKEQFHLFVLSASPHFYEQAITNWLYKHEVNTTNVFLKDYRDFIGAGSGLLSLKDVKRQGFYKLNQLVRILAMTRIPKKIVLIGDGFESDPFIYLTLYAVLKEREDPWHVWNKLRNNSTFKLTHRQHSLFISKLHSLSEEAKQIENLDIQIHIRCAQGQTEYVRNKKYHLDFIDRNLDKLKLYEN